MNYPEKPESSKSLRKAKNELPGKTGEFKVSWISLYFNCSENSKSSLYIIMTKTDILVYQAPNGDLCLDKNLQGEDIWLTREQIWFIFDRESKTIWEHIQSIYEQGELAADETSKEEKVEKQEWKRMVKRNIDHFNLDMIISVWYRVDSKQATQFRKRATSTLKDHVTKWYTINTKRLEQTWVEWLQKSFEMLKRAIESKALSDDETKGMLDLIMAYLPGFLTMNKYDQRALEGLGETNEEQYKIDRLDAVVALANLKSQLIAKGEATDLFAHPKSDGGLDACFGAIYQTDSGVDLYSSVEEKAAMLMYLIIKNHPFTDGNKRSWAYLFIRYLNKNNLLIDEQGKEKISHQTMVALALLIATSDPAEKNSMVALVVALLR